MAFTEKHVYTGSWDQRIFRYNRETLVPDANCLFFISEDEPVASERDFIKSVCSTPDGKYLFSGTADGKIYRWELPEQDFLEKRYIVPHKLKLVGNRFVSAMINLPNNLLCFGGSERKVTIMDYDFNVKLEFALIINITKFYWVDNKLWVITADKDLSVYELPGRIFGEANDIAEPTRVKRWEFDCYLSDAWITENYRTEGIYVGDWKFRLTKLSWQDTEARLVIPCGAQENVTNVEICDHEITKGELKKVCKMIVYGSAD